MCGRYTLKKDKTAYAVYIRSLSFEEISQNPRQLGLSFESSFNVAPTQDVVGLMTMDPVGPPEFQTFRWGVLPHWAMSAKDVPLMINTRAETLGEKPAFRQAKTTRCLVLADGFYEWKREGNTKAPHHIRLKGEPIFGFAGVVATWKEPTGGRLVWSCAIVTCEPNELVGQIHDRMPVILPPAKAREWIDRRNQEKEFLAPLLKSFPAEEMEAFRVGDAVGNSRNQGPELVQPLAD